MLKLNEMSDVKQIRDQKSRYHSILNCALLHVENQIYVIFLGPVILQMAEK